MSLLVITMLFIYTLACFFLIFVILIQSGDKGGGLSSLGSSSQGLSDALGATGAEKTLNMWTTVSAVVFIVLAIALTWTINAISVSSKNVIKENPISQPLTGASSGAGLTPGTATGADVDVPVQTNVEAPAAGAVTAPAAPAAGGPATTAGELPNAPEPAAAAPATGVPAAPAAGTTQP